MVRAQDTAIFRAGQSISLGSGFGVVGGATRFVAEIAECQVVPLPASAFLRGDEQ